MSEEIADEGTPLEDWQARAIAAEQEVEQLRHQHEERMRRAELKIEAVRAGMIDLDGLKLIDPGTESEPNAEGEVPDAATLMAQLKRDKPWLFNAASSSSTARAPRAEVPRTRHANELSEAEWRTARADLLRRVGG